MSNMNSGKEPPKGGSKWTDPLTSHLGAKADTIPGHRESVVEVIRDAGDRGATWDETCDAINEMYLAAGYDVQVRPGSISPRFRELRKLGLIRRQLDADRAVVTRVGASGFEQDVYVLRKDGEPVDVIETDIDEFLDETKHGDDCLHCRLGTTIREFCATHPGSDYAEDIQAALAAVVGDRLATDEARSFVKSDVRDLTRWIKQRIKFIRQARSSR